MIITVTTLLSSAKLVIGIHKLQSNKKYNRSDALEGRSQKGQAEVESQRSEEQKNEEGICSFLHSSILIWGNGLKPYGAWAFIHVGRGPVAQ